eukprot:g1762.t1
MVRTVLCLLIVALAAGADDAPVSESATAPAAEAPTPAPAEKAKSKGYEPTARMARCVEVDLPKDQKGEDWEFCKDALMDCKNNMEVHRLLERGHDPDRSLDFQGRTLLLLATFKGQKDIVAELINFGNADVRKKAGTGHNALMYAAGEGHTDLMTMFLTAGASVNDQVTGLYLEDGSRPEKYNAARAMEGYTALHFACRNFKLRAAAMLLDAGADMDVTEYSGKKPLDFALVSQSKHVRNRFEMLFKETAKSRAKAKQKQEEL